MSHKKVPIGTVWTFL